MYWQDLSGWVGNLIKSTIDRLDTLAGAAVDVVYIALNWTIQNGSILESSNESN